MKTSQFMSDISKRPSPISIDSTSKIRIQNYTQKDLDSIKNVIGTKSKKRPFKKS